MSAPNLVAIKARVDKATPGPWGLWGMSVGTMADGPERDDSKMVARTFYHDDNGKPRTWDASFIAHAREDVPALVAEVARLRTELTEARAQLSVCHATLMDIHAQLSRLASGGAA